MLHLSYFTTTTWSKTVLSLFSHLKTTNKVKKKPWNGILYICGMHAINTGSYSSKGDGLINVQNCTVCIKHSLKDLRQNNPGTLSPPSLHKWEMLSNSNLQTGDLCSQTTHTHTHSSEDSSTYTRTHACSKAYTPPHRVYAKLGLPLYFFFSSHVASTPRHKYTWYERFSFCDGCYVAVYCNTSSLTHLYRHCVWFSVLLCKGMSMYVLLYKRTLHTSYSWLCGNVLEELSVSS